MKHTVIAFAFAALTLHAGASHADALADIKAKGTLTVGIVPNYPPLDMRDPATNKLTGFDVEFGEAIAKKLGISIEWKETSFEQLLSGIKTRRLDAVISGMTDLPPRQEVATFVDYLQSGPQFFTQAKRKAEFADMSAICGKSVGASRRTSLPKEIEKWSASNCVAKNLPPIKYVGTEGSADARTQLRQGRIDAAMQGNETMPYLFAQDPDTYAYIGEPVTMTLFGIALPKEEKGLHEAVAQAVTEIIKDGTYSELTKKWDLSKNNISNVTINGGK